MRQVLIKQGRAVVEVVPAPEVEPGTVLVQVDHSCISVGTEKSQLANTGIPLWRRILTQPENVKKGLQMLAAQGWGRTRSLLQGQLSAASPTGYSAAGTVLEAGEGIEDLKPGMRVACAGALFAHHAEVIRVPRNLIAPIPDGVDFPAASTVTLGAIALQGIRRAQPSLGETFVVIGLGILGQLTVQILRANGCRVIGMDLDRERIKLAEGLGLALGIHPDDGGDIEQVARLTDGIGADGVIITAAAKSDEVASTAFRMCRRKGRVVLVGDVGLALNRGDLYPKELDFFISTSYGPGRYDPNYEEKGLDYPVAYVRWTENRNMAEYLRLLAEGVVRVQPLVTKIYPLDEAPRAYEELKEPGGKSITVLLSYPSEAPKAPVRVVSNPTAKASGPQQIRIAVVGAGGFAKGMHLPNLQGLSDRYHLRAVMSRTGHNALAASRQFGADYAATDYREVLKDPEMDAVLLATRHNRHAQMTLEALEAGVHVLVEKPLALTQAELMQIQAFFAAPPPGGTLPVLLTGFNRRFSPIAGRIFELVRDRSHPMILNYRMNAGYIPLDHWVHSEEGGGRNRGEACHIYDLFTYFTGSRVKTIEARSIAPPSGYYSPSDNFVACLTFEDGSVCTLTYTALGSRDYPKEQLEIFVDGKVLFLDDYRRLTVAGGGFKGLECRVAEKGHKEELEAFAHAIQEGGEWPIPLWQQFQAAEISFEVEKRLNA